MPTAVVMPKQGQTVESCIIANWKKAKGDSVSAGEVLCEVETDKALLEVDSPANGVLLDIFFQAGDDVPVLTNIAAVGQPGEDTSSLRPTAATTAAAAPAPAGQVEPAKLAVTEAAASQAVPAALAGSNGGVVGVSPRARKLAQARGVETANLTGSGPGGRIIERDVQALLARQPALTPLAKTMVAQGGFTVPAPGSGVSGRIRAADLVPATPAVPAQPATPVAVPVATDEVQVIPVKGIRKVIATRMLQSLQTTAQLTLNSSADARALLAYRQQLKESAEPLGLRKVTINDLILLAVSRTLPQHPEINALFSDDAIYRHKNVHLGLAVDTPRGLMVPVIRQANTLSLKQISQEARRLASACLEGNISPDELTGGTFTVTNLGSLGVESFTPVLNPPQVAILGVSNINLKPVEVEGEVKFIPHLGLSLTINHQVVDGAPAARFLQALAQGVAQFELLLAL